MTFETELSPEDIRHRARCKARYAANRDRERELAKERSRRRYAEKKEAILKQQAEYRSKNGDRRRAVERKYREANKERRQGALRDAQIKHKYGITLAERDAMFAAQGFKCASCYREDPGGPRGWHVDHCHRTGRVRGILCRGCNVTLGNVKDDVERLKNLIRYLEK